MCIYIYIDALMEGMARALVQDGTAWHTVAWQGTACHGSVLAWYGMVRYDTGMGVGIGVG